MRFFPLPKRPPGALRRICALLIVVLALRNGPVFGQPTVDADPPTADQLFRRGLAAYETHDYQRARDLLEAAHGLEPRPDSLFAWAQATRQLGLCAQARELFDRFIKANPGPRKIEAARLAMARCTERALPEAKPVDVASPPAPKKVTATPPLAPAPAPVPTLQVVASTKEDGRRWYHDRWSPGLFAGGAALGVLGWLALDTARSRAAAAAEATSYDDYGARHDRAVAWDRIGVAALVGGSALFLGGTGRYLQLSLSDRATAGTLGLRIKGSF